MNIRISKATAAQVASAVRSALGPLDIRLEVGKREFDYTYGNDDHFAYIVTAIMPNGLRRRFIADHIERHYKSAPTLELLAAEFAQKIIASYTDADAIAQSVAEVRAAAEAVFADSKHRPLGLRLVDVTPKVCEITLPDDRLYLTIEMTHYDEQLHVRHVFFETDGAEDAGDSIQHWMPQQHMRYARAQALNAAGAAGTVDAVTLKVLKQLGLGLPDALAKLGTDEKARMKVPANRKLKHLMVHRAEGIVTSEFALGDGTKWEHGTLTLYGDSDLAWAATAKTGQAMGTKPGNRLLAGLEVDRVTLKQSAAVIQLRTPLFYYDDEGRIMGAAPPMALRDEHGRTAHDDEALSMRDNVGDDQDGGDESPATSLRRELRGPG